MWIFCQRIVDIVDTDNNSDKIAKGFYFMFVYQRHQCSKLRLLLFSEKLLNIESLVLGKGTEQSCAVTFITCLRAVILIISFLLLLFVNTIVYFTWLYCWRHCIFISSINTKYSRQHRFSLVHYFVYSRSILLLCIIILYSHRSASSCKQIHMQRITMDSKQTVTW